jgi:hypothetical protein
MTKKIGDKKIGGVHGTTETSAVEGTDVVGSVGGVKAATGVGGVSGPGAVSKRRSTRTMTLAEREQLFQMINEEAEKLFGDSQMSPTQRNVVKNAVRMAVDAGIIEDEPEGSQKKR